MLIQYLIEKQNFIEFLGLLPGQIYTYSVPINDWDFQYFFRLPYSTNDFRIKIIDKK